MATCDVCGAQVNMPYNCRHCGGTHCSEHRLPENHNCTGLQNWNDPGGVFDSGFDASTTGSESASTRSKLANAIPIDTGPGGPLAYFRGNVTYTFLAIIWLTMAAQFVAFAIGGPQLHRALFTLSSAHPEYVWTWVTSIFAHSPIFLADGSFLHIVFNSIVLFFFGPLVERYVGSKEFAILFLVSGVLAGVGQLGITAFYGGQTALLGASGAVMALLGVVTILNPDLRVYLMFVIPMPIWILSAGTAVISALLIVTGAPTAGGIAHGAHLVGLLVGLAYGKYLERNGNVRMPNQYQIGGGGPGGPGGPGGGRGRF